jgi:hypothetical protein
VRVLLQDRMETVVEQPVEHRLAHIVLTVVLATVLRHDQRLQATLTQ